MGRIIVNIMPKQARTEANDQEMLDAAHKAGLSRVTRVSSGRRLYLFVDGDITDADLERVRRAVTNEMLADGEDVTGVFVGGAHMAMDDDDWDAYASGVGAMAPIPEGAGQHEPKTVGHREVSPEQTRDLTGGVYLADDES